MGASKFRQDVIQRVLQAAAIGCSQETCAALAGIDQATLSRWLKKGREELEHAQDPDNLPAFAQFARDFAQCQASQIEHALTVIDREMDTNPMLAWKVVERREKGYQPPAPALPEKPSGPVIIQLKLANGAPLESERTIIDVGGDVDGTGSSGAASSEGPSSALAPVVPLADGGSE